MPRIEIKIDYRDDSVNIISDWEARQNQHAEIVIGALTPERTHDLMDRALAALGIKEQP